MKKLGRGEFTVELAWYVLGKYGIAIDVGVLRLMPYLMYLVVNGESVSRRRVKEDEESIIIEMVANGWIKLPYDDLSVTREFYDMANDILWYSYIARENPPYISEDDFVPAVDVFKL